MCLPHLWREIDFSESVRAVLLRKLSIVTAIRYEASHYMTENCLDWVLSSTQTCTTWRWTTIKKSGRESIRGSPKDVSVTGPSRDSRASNVDEFRGPDGLGILTALSRESLVFAFLDHSTVSRKVCTSDPIEQMSDRVFGAK
ncbi:MAG: hypothetical protein J3Q66DRAFT_376205 [Benniella sp.]|nr:MAG: hypothetical protein J3Q66DRAFT_376205 [Benniella sp.]